MIKFVARSIAIVLLAVLASFAGFTGSHSTPSASASTPNVNFAGVVIDTGDAVKKTCIGFTESSISGKQALDRTSGASPIYYGFSAQGVAVCSLCHKGCPGNSTCLTCGGANYWAYSRMPSGTNAFAYSHAGAGVTTVRNGDVEGWRWSSGAVPAAASFGSVCPASTQAAIRASFSTSGSSPTTAHVLSNSVSNDQSTSVTSSANKPNTNKKSKHSTTTVEGHKGSARTYARGTTATTIETDNVRAGIKKTPGLQWFLLAFAAICLGFVVFRTKRLAKKLDREIEGEEDEDFGDSTPDQDV